MWWFVSLLQATSSGGDGHGQGLKRKISDFFQRAKNVSSSKRHVTDPAGPDQDQCCVSNEGHGIGIESETPAASAEWGLDCTDVSLGTNLKFCCVLLLCQLIYK